jgi:hypothetical protein
VRSAAGDGIGVATTGDGVVLDTIVTGNIAAASAGDGIHVTAATTRVIANVATGNGRYGINAVPGTRDGGRNVAFANCGPTQCVTITCGTTLRPGDGTTLQPRDAGRPPSCGAA